MNIGNVENSEEIASSQVNPTEVVYSLIDGLKPRTKDIIMKRFGLDSNKKQTLEEIGKFHGITRERVRQIESATIRDLKKDEKLSKLSECEQVLENVLHSNGKLAEHKKLIQEFNSQINPSQAHENVVEFILNLSDKFEYFDETDHTKRAWGLKESDLDLPQKVVDALVDKLTAKKKPMTEDEAIKSVMDHSVVKEFNIDDQNAVKSYLNLSKKVLSNPFKEWGLSTWNEIIPKGVKDKAYLVLKKHGKPLHFTGITEKINEAKFSGKKAIPQTVHNELIKDKRFVLVGRGMYALVEWGYNPGTVADVIEAVLRKAEGPMDKDEIVEKVLEQRIVKRNTIILALQNRDKFKKTSDRKFAVSE